MPPSAYQMLAYTLLYYLFELLLLTAQYHSYLRGGSDEPMLLAQALLLFASLALPLYAALLSTPAALPAALLALAATLLAATAPGLRAPRCTAPERLVVDSVEVYVCRCTSANAWYEPRSGRVYTCTALVERLSEDELRAVIHHEAGHAKTRLYALASTLVHSLWLAVIAAIATLVTILGAAAAPYTAMLLVSAASITLPAMLTSWLAEHRADAEAAEKAGPEATASALAKLHAYAALEKHLDLDVVEELRVKNPAEILAAATPPTRREILLTLLARNWRLPLHALDLLRNPTYHTPPPLRFRIARLTAKTPPNI